MNKLRACASRCKHDSLNSNHALSPHTEEYSEAVAFPEAIDGAMQDLAGSDSLQQTAPEGSR